jgi:hypothetical protein
MGGRKWVAAIFSAAAVNEWLSGGAGCALSARACCVKASIAGLAG